MMILAHMLRKQDARPGVETWDSTVSSIQSWSDFLIFVCLSLEMKYKSPKKYEGIYKI